MTLHAITDSELRSQSLRAALDDVSAVKRVTPRARILAENAQPASIGVQSAPAISLPFIDADRRMHLVMNWASPHSTRVYSEPQSLYENWSFRGDLYDASLNDNFAELRNPRAVMPLASATDSADIQLCIVYVPSQYAQGAASFAQFRVAPLADPSAIFAPDFDANFASWCIYDRINACIVTPNHRYFFNAKIDHSFNATRLTGIADYLSAHGLSPADIIELSRGTYTASVGADHIARWFWPGARGASSYSNANDTGAIGLDGWPGDMFALVGQGSGVSRAASQSRRGPLLVQTSSDSLDFEVWHQFVQPIYTQAPSQDLASFWDAPGFVVTTENAQGKIVSKIEGVVPPGATTDNARPLPITQVQAAVFNPFTLQGAVCAASQAWDGSTMRALRQWHSFKG